MKKFTIPKKVETIFGKPFRIIDYNYTPKSADEEPKFIEKASMADLLTLMIYGIPRDKLTTKDSIEAGRFMGQIRGIEDGVLKLEEAEHDWIKEIVDKHGTTVFGVNTAIIMDFLDNFERLHEKKGKEKTKAEAEEKE